MVEIHKACSRSLRSVSVIPAKGDTEEQGELLVIHGIGIHEMGH